MKYTLTLLERHIEELRGLTIKEDGLERPAILLCGVSTINNDLWDGGSECRFLAKEIIPVPDTEIVEHSQTSLKWETNTFRDAMKKAQEQNLAICLVHSHPDGADSFSQTDDENERELFSTIQKRNGNEIPNLSLIIMPDGNLKARACNHRLQYHEINMIREIGNRFVFHYPEKYREVRREEFHRQQLAFGKTLNNDLSQLRVAVVGCGATGSATAHLLAKLGVGQLLLVDNDRVERSNLSRLYGATSSDADAGEEKAMTLKRFITGLGIGCRVKTATDWVGSKESRDAMKSCDIVFGCTDDNSGRIFLNRLSHFYLIPVIDMGIAIDLTDEEPKTIRDIKGRVTVMLPGNTCLFCRGLVDHSKAREEDLLRSDPHGYERLKEEAYVIGERNPSPAVITFTTEVATMSANELLNRITGFRHGGPLTNLVRFFDKGEDRRQGATPREGCRICHQTNYWGKGDMEPFMDQAG